MTHLARQLLQNLPSKLVLTKRLRAWQQQVTTAATIIGGEHEMQESRERERASTWQETAHWRCGGTPQREEGNRLLDGKGERQRQRQSSGQADRLKLDELDDVALRLVAAAALQWQLSLSERVEAYSALRAPIITRPLCSLQRQSSSAPRAQAQDAQAHTSFITIGKWAGFLRRG